MRLVATSRPTLRAAAILTAAILAACGSTRKVEEGTPLCQRCHGGASGNAAPPVSVNGGTATTDLAVGAHQAHVVAGRLRGPMACSECHLNVVPVDMTEHETLIAAIADGTAQRVAFDPVLADLGTGTATFDRATATCSGVYCHGSNMGHGGSNKTPSWTVVDGTQAACGTCHGSPPPGHFAGGCSSCHGGTLNADGSIKFAADGTTLHINGTHDLPAGGCSICHGAPPATGAHLAHVTSAPSVYGEDTSTADTQPTTASAYDFGCGNCHPTDPAQHTLGAVDLSPTSATVGSLKALNGAAAAYDPVTRTCSDVYCHSSGQATPGYVDSPAWDSATTLGCGGCHSNPPSYASGGAATATANSHLGLLTEGNGLTYETGHFGGFPAMLHDGSAHGRSATTVDSSPITCQTCHFDTVDPANTGPSGFYYLDTTGSYDLAGTGSFCFGGTGTACTGGTLVPAYSCTQCHTGTPPAQGGGVRPYFHVNGSRDVAFDLRTAITGTPTLPAAPNTPTRPYWFTGAPAWVAPTLGANGGMEGTTASFHLGGATWDPATKTCSGVVCHFNAANRAPIRWGETLLFGGAPAGTCTVCHNM